MKTQFTKKIYYKKFDHRLVVNVRYNYANKDRHQPTTEIMDWLLLTNFTKHEYKLITSYSYDSKSQKSTVFFKDTKIYDYLTKTIDTKFIETYEKPIDDEHAAMLGANDKLITRKTLFFNKYRMVLRISPERISAWQTSNQNIITMKQWCTEQFGCQFQNDDRWRTSGCTNGNFYFSDTKDALLFKLTWGGGEVKTERVVTFDELEKAGE